MDAFGFADFYTSQFIEQRSKLTFRSCTPLAVPIRASSQAGLQEQRLL